jgi:hypothetical protein
LRNTVLPELLVFVGIVEIFFEGGRRGDEEGNWGGGRGRGRGEGEGRGEGSGKEEYMMRDFRANQPEPGATAA